MPAIVTNKFRIHNAKQFVEAFDEISTTSGAAITDASGLLNTNMYLFIGKVTSWTDDTAPPTPTDSVSNTVYNHWRDMIAAKKIGSTDVSHVCPRYNWTSGTNYFAYTHANNALFDQTFYVMTEDYNVYKCLSNNNTDGASTTKPTGTGTSIVATGDGYKWKFMYQISAARALKFVTPSYIPTQRVRKSNAAIANTSDSSFQYDVEIAANTSGNGAIEVGHVTAGGTGYIFETDVLVTHTGNSTTCKIAGTGISGNTIVGSDIYFTSEAGSSGVTGKGGTITSYIAGTDIDSYIAANPLNLTNAVEEINTQYWVASFLNGPELFANFRRSGYPDLTPNPYPAQDITGDFINRLTYPPAEIAVNQANLQEAVSRMGPDNLDTKVWWDVD